MEEIINIATLTIDKTEANKSIVETKQAIFDLQKQIRNCAKTFLKTETLQENKLKSLSRTSRPSKTKR